MENDSAVASTHQKDTNLTDKLFTFEKPLKDITQNDILLNIAEKAKKIQGAVYMVAKFIPVDDPMHYDVKKTSTDLMDLLFVKDIIDPVLCGKIFMQSVVYIDKLVAQIETASLAAYITMMNRAVLVDALTDMRSTVTQYALHTMQSESAPYVPDHVAYFSIPKALVKNIQTPAKAPSGMQAAASQSSVQNDIEIAKSPKPISVVKPLQNDIQKAVVNEPMSVKNNVVKPGNERQQVILSLMQNKNVVTIADIISQIKGVSEKTIQRDLIDLIQKGQIAREGNKRWSTYRIIRSA